MAAIAVADEVVVVGLGGMHGCLERTLAGISDRARRQSGMSVGVIRRVDPHVSVMKSALVIAVEQFRIDDTGIGIERNMVCQAVVIHAGHEWTLVWNTGVFLDDSAHRDRLLDVASHADLLRFL